MSEFPEPLVTISLKEYNQLLITKDTADKNIYKRFVNSLLRHRDFNGPVGGFMRNVMHEEKVRIVQAGDDFEITEAK